MGAENGAIPGVSDGICGQFEPIMEPPTNSLGPRGQVCTSGKNLRPASSRVSADPGSFGRSFGGISSQAAAGLSAAANR